MFGFFDTIIEFIQIAWSFFLNSITSLFTAITTLITSTATTTTLSGNMPWFISTSCILSLFILVINYIIGRSNQ